MKRHIAAVVGLVGITLLQFRNAFGVHFFQDDYWFLEISRIHDLSGFLHFFSPFRSYSYKPLASETFYLVIHWLQHNVFWSHAIMFVTFLIGVLFLYKVILALTQEKLLAVLTAFLYLIHFTHVFQLYWFATFQEIAMMALLTLSTYFLLNHRYVIGFIPFLLALLCKETAALFPIGLLLIAVFDSKKRISWKTIAVGFLFSGIFYFIYRFSLNQVTSLDNYKMAFNPRLIANNMAWYSLWGFGLPNLMPLYTPSLFRSPAPEFWNLFQIPEFKTYFLYLMLYVLLFGGSVMSLMLMEKKERKSFLWYGLFCMGGFFIFLGPMLFFPHRWMVRLTVPLIFFSLFQAYVLWRLFTHSAIWRVTSLALLMLYAVWNFYGTRFHESSSLYLPENDIYLRTEAVFAEHAIQITHAGVIFFQDDDRNRKYATQNSERLKNSFHDQSFLDHFFPGYSMHALYDFETDQIPPNAYIINTYDLVR